MRRWILVCSALVLVVCGCASRRTPELAPEEVVYKFYRWYIGYPGNPLVDRAYRDSSYLTERLVTEIDETLDSFTRGAYDPILMAQDIPGSFTVDEAQTSGDRSTVTVHLIWGPSSPSRELEIELVRAGSEWKMDDIVMADR